MLPLRGQLCALAGASDLTARAGKYSASQPPRSLRDLAAGDLSLGGIEALTLDCALADDDDPPVPRLLGLCPCSLSLLSLSHCLCEGGGRCACMCPQCRVMDVELGGILDQGLDQSLRVRM